jgi:hypothetical protein
MRETAGIFWIMSPLLYPLGYELACLHLTTTAENFGSASSPFLVASRADQAAGSELRLVNGPKV